MPRTPPSRTPAQQREHERRQALASLDIAALRAWMEQDGGYASADDALVLQAAHEARAVDLRMLRHLRDASLAWLREHHPESTTLATVAHYPGEFRGPIYGRRRTP